MVIPADIGECRGQYICWHPACAGVSHTGNNDVQVRLDWKGSFAKTKKHGLATLLVCAGFVESATMERPSQWI